MEEKLNKLFNKNLMDLIKAITKLIVKTEKVDIENIKVYWDKPIKIEYIKDGNPNYILVNPAEIGVM